MNVAVIGASANPTRTSYTALNMLRDAGHQVFPVHPKLQEIDGEKVYSSLSEIPEPIDTVSLYISEKISTAMGKTLFSKGLRRVIFNPGAENDQLMEVCKGKGIVSLNACTLTMLRTGEF